MPRVVHFEIHADEPERAVDFYRKVFGWEIRRWSGPVEYWTVNTGDNREEGINGGIARRINHGSVYTTIDVPSVDDFTERILKTGGRIVVPKRAVPGMGYVAYCEDTEGNIFGIMQADSSAH